MDFTTAIGTTASKSYGRDVSSVEVRSDSDCLARSLREPRVFELIFDRHFSAVHAYLVRRGGVDLADDLAAETFTLAFERRASCRATGSVLPWLYGIATNLLRQGCRAEHRRRRAYGRSGIERWVFFEEEADSRVDGSSLEARLAGALAAMPRRQREALLLYALADLSYEEIALALDVPIGTVRGWLYRARGSAQRLLAEERDNSSVTSSGADHDG